MTPARCATVWNVYRVAKYGDIKVGDVIEAFVTERMPPK